MRGTLRKQKCGYHWMRVGFAETGFTLALMLASITAMVFLTLWVYREIPETELRLIYFMSIYLIAAALYANLGVWLHEQLHCLAFRGNIHERRVTIHYRRKYLLVLNGHYSVTGSLQYRILQRALLGPLILVFIFLVAGWLGNYILPGWWLPLMLSMGVAGIIDMIHDLYWCWQIRRVGGKGRYWDNGRELHVVWKG